MKLSIKENSQNYACTVVQIGTIYPIEGADKIRRTVVSGNNVVIGTDVKTGDIMLYFCAMTRLSPDYLTYNNLYDNPELNKDKTKGYISHKGRVRAIKLRGIISDGICMPLSSLKEILPKNSDVIFKLNIGDEFTDIDDVSVCEKYFVPINNSGSGEPRVKPPKLTELLLPGQFRFHFDTAHLVKNAHKLNADSYIVISDKWHGSSCILSKVHVKRKLSWLERLAKRVGVKVHESEYAGIYSSGKPKSALPKGIESMYTNPNPDYYSKNIWKDAYEKYKECIEPGISIYSELCASHIQKKYDYGATEEPRMVVYRITRTNDAGLVDEFSWNQVEEYCDKYNLEIVKVIFKGTIRQWQESISYDMDLRNFVDNLTEEYLEKKCVYCTNDVWAEGICVRTEKPFEVFKLKSANFKADEDKAQEAGETNIEDNQE